MRWSYRIGSLAGIPVRVHATFPLLLLWVALPELTRGKGPAGALYMVVFVLALFACVVLHELGHALTARAYGIRTRDITLLPIGGVARMERMPDKPVQELWVALAGPAVNVAIALALALLLAATSGLPSASEVSAGRGSFLGQLMVVNLLLVGFNLLPAFPMDGGRVVRALLATRLSYVRATHIAAGLGRGMALLFALLGLWVGNPFLVLVALFVWIGAGAESGTVEMRTALGGIPVRSAMLTDFRVLSPTDPLRRAVDLVLAGSQQDFPVVDGGRVVGVLLRSDMISALSRVGPEGDVGSAMRTDFATASAWEPLDVALPRMQEKRNHVMPVLEGDRLVGLVTHENVGEFLAIQASVRRARAASVSGSRFSVLPGARD